MNAKKNIKSFGKTYEYLSNPELRQTETGSSLLVVNDAEISDVNFQKISWRNINFLNCDFIGGYEIKLSELQNCTFENCRFSGIISWGVAKSVRFVRCQAAGQSNVIDLSGSEDIRFESCAFIGTNADVNRWGAIGSRGDATFIDCKAKWFKLAGYKKIALDGCKTQDVGTWTDSAANSGAQYESASVVLNNSKLRGKFDMRAADLQSLTIRDTVLEELNLSNATIKGDVVIERVKGNFIHAGVAAVRSLTVSNCEILGNGRDVSFLMSMDGAQQVLLERTNFGAQMTSKVNLGPGRPLQANEWSAVPLNKSAVIRNCTLPIMDASWLETQHLQIEGNTIGSLNVSNGRIGKLELRGNTIARSVDFTNTQVKESKVQALAKGQAKLDGSNIKLN